VDCELCILEFDVLEALSPLLRAAWILNVVHAYAQDAVLRGQVWHISGGIPANNFIQFPKTSSQSMALVGPYLYFLMKTQAGKPFVIHIDVACTDAVVIRLSFSNITQVFIRVFDKHPWV
jgi:hypothetical protein